MTWRAQRLGMKNNRLIADALTGKPRVREATTRLTKDAQELGSPGGGWGAVKKGGRDEHLVVGDPPEGAGA